MAEEDGDARGVDVSKQKALAFFLNKLKLLNYKLPRSKM